MIIIFLVHNSGHIIVWAIIKVANTRGKFVASIIRLANHPSYKREDSKYPILSASALTAT